jgi:hypothetical protein
MRKHRDAGSLHFLRIAGLGIENDGAGFRVRQEARVDEPVFSGRIPAEPLKSLPEFAVVVLQTHAIAIAAMDYGEL